MLTRGTCQITRRHRRTEDSRASLGRRSRAGRDSGQIGQAWNGRRVLRDRSHGKPYMALLTPRRSVLAIGLPPGELGHWKSILIAYKDVEHERAVPWG